MQGCDGLVEQLQHIFHKNIDLFEMYVLKNIFVVPAAEEVSEALMLMVGALKLLPGAGS
jgi:hypothetical protein